MKFQEQIPTWAATPVIYCTTWSIGCTLLGQRSLLPCVDGSARFNIPPNTLWVISGTGFYGSNDPTNSVKAL